MATTLWIVSTHSEQKVNLSCMKIYAKIMIMVKIPEEDNSILKCNQDKKYLKIPFIIYHSLWITAWKNSHML